MRRAATMKSGLMLCGLALFTVGVNLAHADTSNQVPSCYTANKMIIPAWQQEFFILLDETTPLDENLQAALYSATQSLLKPGVKFSVLSFSAFTQGRYLNPVASGVLESSLEKKERSSVGVKVLKNLDSCMTSQLRYGQDLAIKAEKRVLQNSTANLNKSDVIASLTAVARLVKASAAPNKTVFIVSDMLENSSVSSFYNKNAVRKIDPNKELDLVTRENLMGDFGGANVYVMGAGIVSEAKQAVYRDPKTMGALKSFWQSYFQKSKANLVEFGAPALLGAIR